MLVAIPAPVASELCPQSSVNSTIYKRFIAAQITSATEDFYFPHCEVIISISLYTEGQSLTQKTKAVWVSSHHVPSFPDGHNLRHKYYKEYFGKLLA